jgi:hypothetical protein
MRVRILTKMHGAIDGFDLDKFEVGHAYEVGTALANYLLASRYAVPIADDEPVMITPLDDVKRTSEPQKQSKAADRSKSRNP